MIEIPAVGRLVERRGLQRPVLGSLADVAPEHLERAPGVCAAAASHAVGEYRGVHGARRGARDRLDLETLFLQQTVENAPSVSAVRAAALQGEIDALGLHVVSSVPL